MRRVGVRPEGQLGAAATDYSSHLIRAAQSGAQVVKIAAAGVDSVNIVKQMGGFGLIRRGLQPAALLCLLTNIKAIGLEQAQGLVFTEAYHWDRNDGTRAFAQRVARLHGRRPTMFQASMWGAMTHYLKAVQAAGTDAAAPVMATMREMPINDFMARNGRLREDGRVIRDMYLMRARRPGEARGEWDPLDVVATIPGEEAFRPLSQSECPLVRRPAERRPAPAVPFASAAPLRSCVSRVPGPIRRRAARAGPRARPAPFGEPKA